MRWCRTRRRWTCEAVAAGVTDYFDGALCGAKRARFERHLEDCVDCRLYVAQYVQTLNALAMLHAGDPDPDGLDALLEAFREHVG